MLGLHPARAGVAGVSYRKHSISKFARKQHKKRAQKRKAKLAGVAAFAYASSVGVSKKRLSSRMSRIG